MLWEFNSPKVDMADHAVRPTYGIAAASTLDRFLGLWLTYKQTKVDSLLAKQDNQSDYEHTELSEVTT